MYQGILHLHNLGRWVIILLLIVVIINALRGAAGAKPYGKNDASLALLLMITAHIMFVIGMYQWIAGPWGLQNILSVGMGAAMKNKVYRFWGVEHFTGMLIGIVLITLGRGVGRKLITDKAKHRRALWLYLFAFIAIIVSVPWPFREVARPLFPGGTV